MSSDFTPPESTGPTDTHKSFWGHLEDLRSAMIRSIIGLGLALILCLIFVDRLVKIVEYPLWRIDLLEKPKPTVAFRVGNTKFGPYVVTNDQFSALPPGTAPHAVYQMDTTRVGSNDLVSLRLLPDADEGGASAMRVHLHNFGPADGFFVAFHVALYSALILSAPIWMYFMGGFILPALNVRERKALFPWLTWSVVLFLVGVCATYFVLLPISLRASVEYSNILGFEGFDWRAEDYISFVTHFIFGMGLGFQFPVVVLFLVKIGVLTHAHLAKYRRHVAVLSFILGAVLTTPEVVTQVAMAIPLYVLYESCIWIAWYWERKKRREAKAAGGVVDI